MKMSKNDKEGGNIFEEKKKENNKFVRGVSVERGQCF